MSASTRGHTARQTQALTQTVASLPRLSSVPSLPIGSMLSSNNQVFRTSPHAILYLPRFYIIFLVVFIL